MDPARTVVATILFTDIEGSTRLWEQQPDGMRSALERHDAICRRIVDVHHGTVVKMTGDGMYAAFEHAVDALHATLALQCALAEPVGPGGVELRARCGLHAGAVERRDSDFFGNVVNRAARIMSAAHGGQMLVSKAVADIVSDHLPGAVTLLDLGAVRLRDLAEPERLYQVVHPTLRAAFPALRSLASTPNNLPQQVTSFVGREQQVADATTILGEHQLLTLLGIGGLGKTRLALQVAAGLLDAFPDGVWLVELASLSDGRSVAQAVASVLGVKEETGRPVQETLDDFVRDRTLLLVLDNCEHVLHACASVVRTLLAHGPRLKILATSREPLREAGEVSLQLSALPVPDDDPAPRVDELASLESVRLFVDRAKASQSSFALTEKNAAAVAAICRRLDGIPLALELAAARVRSLDVATIADRLDDRFRVLATGHRTALPRQQTLRACIDWSYNLLTPSERTLLRRLAVFAGGFVLEAAERVGADGDIDASDVIALLAQLVDKSLVESIAEQRRFRLLETVRQYGLELLRASGEVEAALARHLVFYLAFADEARAQLSGPLQGEWLRKLDDERENVLVAHACCGAEDGRGEAGLRLVAAIHGYWMRRGALRLGHRTTVEALGRPGAQRRSLARCEALYAAANLGSVMARAPEAQAYARESLAIARELGDRERVASALVLLGTLLGNQGDLASARTCYEESLLIAEELGNPHRLASVLGSLAVLHGMEGNLDKADGLFVRSLALSRTQGNVNVVAANLCNLAVVAIRRNDAARSRTYLGEALTIAEAAGARSLGLAVLSIGTLLEATDGNFERAARSYGAWLAECERQGSDPHRDDELLTPQIARMREALGDARYAETQREGQRLDYVAAMGEMRGWLAAG